MSAPSSPRPVDNTSASGPSRSPGETDADAAVARRILRSASTGTLCTLDRSSGHPFGSFVTLATSARNEAVMLLSGLAQHTGNVRADARASLLVTDTSLGGDPLTSARVTIVGRLEQLAGADPAKAELRRRYLARHPSAIGYVDFGDFGFYRLVAERAHMVAGFGRIMAIGGDALVVDAADVASLAREEAKLLSEIALSHRRLWQTIAERHGQPGLAAQPIGLDLEGLDVLVGDRIVRAHSPSPMIDRSQLDGWLATVSASDFV